MIKLRYWLFSTQECHDPMEFMGRFSSFKQAQRAVPAGHESAHVYDVEKGARRWYWAGYGKKGWRPWESVDEPSEQSIWGI